MNKSYLNSVFENKSFKAKMKSKLSKRKNDAILAACRNKKAVKSISNTYPMIDETIERGSKCLHVLSHGYYEREMNDQERLEVMDKVTVFPFKRYTEANTINFLRSNILPSLDLIYGKSRDDLFYLAGLITDPNYLALLDNLTGMFREVPHRQCVVEIDSVNPTTKERYISVRHLIPRNVYKLGKNLSYTVKIMSIIAQATHKTSSNITGRASMNILSLTESANIHDVESYTYDVFTKRASSAKQFMDKHVVKQSYHVMEPCDKLAVEFTVPVPVINNAGNICDSVSGDRTIESKFRCFII